MPYVLPLALPSIQISTFHQNLLMINLPYAFVQVIPVRSQSLIKTTADIISCYNWLELCWARVSHVESKRSAKDSRQEDGIPAKHAAIPESVGGSCREENGGLLVNSTCDLLEKHVNVFIQTAHKRPMLTPGILTVATTSQIGWRAIPPLFLVVSRYC